VEAAGQQENARSQHRPQFEADRKCHPAEGFQPWSLVGNAQWPAWIGRTKRSGPVAQALKVAKRGRTPAHTQNTSAFFGAVRLDPLSRRTGKNRTSHIF